MDKFKFVKDRSFDELPKTSGVYCFAEKVSEARRPLIYIGKAINIRNRVKNHFQQPSYRDNLFMDKAGKIGFLETGSEIEALILEANLIKKYQPKFNVVWRDDKNYFYVAVAQNEDRIPYIFITHQPNTKHPTPNTQFVGPFVEGTALKKTLKFLSRVFPYYTTTKHPKIKCTYCHLGLCPGPEPDLVKYKKNIKKLILILKGKRNAALNSLKKEMNKLSGENKFEEAAKIRDRIYNLQQVMSHTHVISDSEKMATNLTAVKNTTISMLQGLLGLKKIHKIECYDVSNIQGKFATASMVVFTDGVADKSQYKKFKIRMKNEPDDIAMLNETIERRLAHKEWPLPDVMLIDGGKAQLNVAIKIKNQIAKTKNIKVASIAKRNKELFIEGRNKPILLKTLPQGIYNLILQLDDEAHRFAIAYHKKLRKNSLLP